MNSFKLPLSFFLLLSLLNVEVHALAPKDIFSKPWIFDLSKDVEPVLGADSEIRKAAQEWLTELGPISLVAQNTNVRRTPAQVRRRGRSRRQGQVDSRLRSALALAKSGEYEQASIELFRLSRSPSFRGQRIRIKYILGLMLFEMELHQLSAFQFVDVIRSKGRRYVRESLEKLSLAADAMNDDTLLNFALSRVRVRDFPKQHRDMLFFRIGEIQMRNRNFPASIRSFARVGEGSRFYGQAKYNQGLAYAEINQLKRSLSAFTSLANNRRTEGITDTNRVAALLGRARVLYQRKEWDRAIEAYRLIPRDTSFWHETLFEQSWAMMRSARFRSALSNFHSLHSPYYEEFYIPESLLLRAIVYLYICRYEEMEKVIKLFEDTYKPVRKQILKFLRAHRTPQPYFQEMLKAERVLDGEDQKVDLDLPLLISRYIAQEGDYKRSFDYRARLMDEDRMMESMPLNWQRASIGKYGRRIIKTRIENTEKAIGRIIRAHMIRLATELRSLFEQNGFLRFEMFNGKKEAIKKKIAEKKVQTNRVDDDSDRDFYIQNGFEYWPFKGEYWLDELGNFHYVGVSACEG